jgi:hypothetical protein
MFLISALMTDVIIQSCLTEFSINVSSTEIKDIEYDNRDNIYIQPLEGRYVATLAETDFTGITTLRLKLKPWSTEYTTLRLIIDNSICGYGSIESKKKILKHRKWNLLINAIVNNSCGDKVIEKLP